MVLGNELTRSNFRRPLLVEALEAMEDTLGKFRVASVDGRILGASCRPENLIKATKLLAKLGKDYLFLYLPCGANITTLASGGVSTTTRFLVPLTNMRPRYS